MRPVIALTAAILLIVMPVALCAQGLGIMKQGSKEPLDIHSDDGIEWDQTRKVYVATGNVRAVQGEVTLYTDQLTAHYRDSKSGGKEVWRINADGNVRIVSTNETAHGDNGIYHVDRGILVLTGRKLRIESPDSNITARDSLEYWEQRRMAVARGEAYAENQENRLWADILAAYMKENSAGKTQLQRIEAFDNVRMTTPQDVVFGDQALYNVVSRTAILCGAVKITRGGNVLTGKVAEVNLTTGVARLRPGPCKFTVQ